MVADPATSLTPRQLELLALYASGYELKEIAAMKFLSWHTVSNNLALARRRVGARSLTHLCVICVDAGLIRKNGNGYKPIEFEGVVGE